MTIMDLVDKKQHVDSHITALDRAEKALGEAFKGVEAALSKKDSKADPSVLAPLQGALYNLANCTTEDRKLLREYSGLLRDIMYRTEMPWPPKCDLKPD